MCSPAFADCRSDQKICQRLFKVFNNADVLGMWCLSTLPQRRRKTSKTTLNASVMKKPFLKFTVCYNTTALRAATGH